MNKTSYFGFSEQYENTRNNLEKQTAALLAERKRLEETSNRPQTYKQPITSIYQESIPITPVALSKKVSENKTQEVVSKLQEIIRLCKEEGALSNEQMRQIVKVQSEVLNYLQRTTGEQEALPAMPLSSSQNVVKTSNSPTPINPQITQTWGKQTQQIKQVHSEDTLEIISHIERRALSQIINLQQERDTIKRQKQAIASQYQKLKIEFSRLSAGYPISQETRFSRIDAGQLQRLREQNRILKLNLTEMDRIRQENQLIKEENQYLNSRLEVLGNTNSIQPRETQKIENRSTYHENPPFNKTGLIYEQYGSQIAVYENQLKRATVVINELRSRLANVPGLEQLHDQGERIRRETAELLQLKSSGISRHDTAVIRELQQKLRMEEKGKEAFLQELKNFKRKYLDLQQEYKLLKKSKVSFDPVPKAAGQNPRREGESHSILISRKKGQLGDYQQTLNQLKNVLY